MGTNLKLLSYLLGTFTIGIAIGYYFRETAVNNSSYISTRNFGWNERSKPLLAFGSHVRLIDFNKKIEKIFNCTKTKLLFGLFQTTICLHDSGKDLHVSQTIFTYKSWEEDLVTKTLRILLKNPDYGKFELIVFRE